MDGDYQIRPATNVDSRAICGVVFGVLREFGLPPDPDGLDADLIEPESSYIHAGGAFDVLVESTGDIVGTIGLFRLDDARCELRKMYLIARCRGLGFGRQLLVHAIGRARELGFQRIELETSSVLQAAARLYESVGFKPCEPHRVTDRVDRAYFLELEGGDQRCEV